MDLVIFENNKPLVIDEFREGRFDYVELASDVAETVGGSLAVGLQFRQPASRCCGWNCCGCIGS